MKTKLNLARFLRFFRWRSVKDGNNVVINVHQKEAEEICEVMPNVQLKKITSALMNQEFLDILDLVKIKMLVKKENMELYPEKLLNLLVEIKKIVEKK